MDAEQIVNKFRTAADAAVLAVRLGAVAADLHHHASLLARWKKHGNLLKVLCKHFEEEGNVASEKVGSTFDRNRPLQVCHPLAEGVELSLVSSHHLLGFGGVYFAILKEGRLCDHPDFSPGEGEEAMLDFVERALALTPEQIAAL